MVGLPPNKRLFFVFSLTFFEGHVIPHRGNSFGKPLYLQIRNVSIE